MAAKARVQKRLYYKIGEACKALGIQPYVLRYWETEFSALSPSKSRSGQRVYNEKELEIIRRIKQLLYDEGYTIAGAKKKLEGELAAGILGDPAAIPPAASNAPAGHDEAAAAVRESLDPGVAAGAPSAPEPTRPGAARASAAATQRSEAARASAQAQPPVAPGGQDIIPLDSPAATLLDEPDEPGEPSPAGARDGESGEAATFPSPGASPGAAVPIASLPPRAHGAGDADRVNGSDGSDGSDGADGAASVNGAGETDETDRTDEEDAAGAHASASPAGTTGPAPAVPVGAASIAATPLAAAPPAGHAPRGADLAPRGGTAPGIPGHSLDTDANKRIETLRTGIYKALQEAREILALLDAKSPQ